MADFAPQRPDQAEQVEAQNNTPQSPKDLATKAKKQEVKSGANDFEKSLEQNSFDTVDSLLNGQNHIEGMSKHGSVSINKNPNGSISIDISGFENGELKTAIFTISPEGKVEGNAEVPQRLKASHEGGGVTDGQYNLHPSFSLNDVLGSLKIKTEKAE